MDTDVQMMVIVLVHKTVNLGLIATNVRDASEQTENKEAFIVAFIWDIMV